MNQSDILWTLKHSRIVPLEKAEIQEFLQTYPPDNFAKALEQLVKALREVVTEAVNQINYAIEQLVKNPAIEVLIVKELHNRCLERQRKRNMKVIKNGMIFKKYLELISR